ncbi:MAG: phosphatase PAP2 family protein [bacterium]
MDFLLSIDTQLFLILNRGVANPVFDIIMPFITESDNWKIPMAIIWLSLIIFGGKKGRIAALLIVLVITLSDQLSSSVIKPLVARIRPCFAVENARLIIHQSHSKSFPSSHAANMSAAALLFSVYYPRFKWIFISVAVLVAYSRIYVGVHYPADIIAGAILGMLCTIFILQLKKLVISIWNKKIKPFYTKVRERHEKENQ